MIKLNLYYAKITNNNDPVKKGKLQIRLLPEFKDIKESLLPWADPFFSIGSSTSSYSMNLPKIGSSVWVAVDEMFTSFNYLFGAPFEGLFDYASVKTSLDTISELSSTTYPDINFNLMESGNIHFENSVTGDIGILHNTGSYVLFDNTGKIYATSVGDITIKDGNGNEVLTSTSGIQLKTGDAVTWKPNILPNCLFTGAPHGGPTGGITKLTGG